MKKIDVRIKVLSPIVLSIAGNSTIMTETKKYIPGSVLRGLLASRYIAERKLLEAADQDEDFRQIFLGGARFVDCNPMCKGVRAVALPLSLRKEKEGTGGKEVPEVKDLLFAEPEEARGFKSFRGMAAVSGNELHKANVKTIINFHMSRSGAEERLKGSSQDGAVYNYEAIREGQDFSGCILGEEGTLRKLAEGLALEGSGFIAHMGASRFTQYGTCRVELGQMAEIEGPPDKYEGNIILRLDTPYIPKDDCKGSARRNLEAVVDRLNGGSAAGNFKLGRVFAENAEIDNFVGIWNMRRPRESALAAGSVFELLHDGEWTEQELASLQELMYGGCGRRREEGFGQLRIWPEMTLSLAKTKKNEKKVEVKCTVPESVKKQICMIVERRILEQLRIYAYEDAQSSRREMGTGMAHFFARLENMLEAAKETNNVRETLARAIRQEREHQDDKLHDTQKARTPFQEHLEKMQIGDSNLEDYLDGSAPLQPYLIPERHKLADSLSDGEERVESLLELAGEKLEDKLQANEYFYEYWHWLFRYGRKNAVQKPGRK